MYVDSTLVQQCQFYASLPAAKKMCHAKTRRREEFKTQYSYSFFPPPSRSSREIISFRWAGGSSPTLADAWVTLMVRKGDGELSYLESKIGGLSDMGSVESVMGLKIPPAPNQS